MLRIKPISETELVMQFLETLRGILPKGWTVQEPERDVLWASSSGSTQVNSLKEETPWLWADLPEPRQRPRRVDAVLNIGAPSGEESRLVIEAKKKLDPRDVPTAIAQVRRDLNEPLLIVCPYVGPRTQQRLVEEGVGYADATGNLRLSLERPALFIQTKGAVTDPWPLDRPLKSLKGPAAGRAVRALCDFRPPFRIRELALRSKTALASLWRVVDLLDREALLQRKERGYIESIDWAGTVRRWTQDYAFPASNSVRTYLEPRGLPVLLERLRQLKEPYAITGSLAVPGETAVAPPRLGAVYVRAAATAAAGLELRASDSGANVIVAEPFDRVVFERTSTRDGLVYAAPSQVVADLLTSPGRGPAEAEALMSWMERNQDAWRT